MKIISIHKIIARILISALFLFIGLESSGQAQNRSMDLYLANTTEIIWLLPQLGIVGGASIAVGSAANIYSTIV